MIRNFTWGLSDFGRGNRPSLLWDKFSHLRQWGAVFSSVKPLWNVQFCPCLSRSIKFRPARAWCGKGKPDGVPLLAVIATSNTDVLVPWESRDYKGRQASVSGLQTVHQYYQKTVSKCINLWDEEWITWETLVQLRRANFSIPNYF